MKNTSFKLKSSVWVYPGLAAWHFVSVNKNTSSIIKNLFGNISAGFGSLPVQVTVGKTSWKTSLFPDNKTKTYLLPLKAQVRKKEGITAGNTIPFVIERENVTILVTNLNSLLTCTHGVTQCVHGAFVSV